MFFPKATSMFCVGSAGLLVALGKRDWYVWVGFWGNEIVFRLCWLKLCVWKQDRCTHQKFSLFVPSTEYRLFTFSETSCCFSTFVTKWIVVTSNCSIHSIIQASWSKNNFLRENFLLGSRKQMVHAGRDFHPQGGLDQAFQRSEWLPGD